MHNAEIRELMRKKRVRQYEVGSAMGISESKFSRMLRVELPEAEKEKIIAIINEIARGDA